MFSPFNTPTENFLRLLDIIVDLVGLTLIFVLGVMFFFQYLPAKIDGAFPVLPEILWLNTLVKTILFSVSFLTLLKLMEVLINKSVVIHLIPDKESHRYQVTDHKDDIYD